MADTYEGYDIEATRKRIFDRYKEPLDEDSIEILKHELLTAVGRVDRLCNMLIMQPKGLGSGVIDSLHDLKCVTSRIRYHLDQRDKPVIRKNIDAIRMLAEHHQEDGDELGVAARALLEVLPVGSET